MAATGADAFAPSIPTGDGDYLMKTITGKSEKGQSSPENDTS